MTADVKSNWWRNLPRVAALAVLAVFGIFALIGLLGAENRLTWSNGVPDAKFVHDLTPATGPLCMSGQIVPAGTGVVELTTGTYGAAGPTTDLTIADEDGKVVARSTLQGYENDEKPRFSIAALDRDIGNAKTCVSVRDGRVAIAGVGVPGASASQELTIDGKSRNEDIHIRYLEDDAASLVSKTGVIASRAALFRPGWVGSWTFYLLIPLVLLAVGIPIWLLVERDARPLSARAWVMAIGCAGFALAFVWSIITPPFHPPDEAAHYSYVESLVHRDHRPYRDPQAPGGSYTDRTNLAVTFTASGLVGNKDARPPWLQAAEDDWARQDAAIEDANGGGWTSAANYSPLYYIPASIPYRAAGESTWTRLWLTRLISALMFAGICILTYLTARELLPRPAWIAPVAGLCATFLPMGSHIAGSVNNDNGLILAAAVTMYTLARAFVRGFDVRLGLLAGTLTALTFIAKPTGIALLPAALLAVVGMTVLGGGRGINSSRRAAPAAAFGVGLIATTAILMVVLGWGEGSTEAAGTGSTGDSASITGLMSYVWQWYLPPLPAMTDFFTGVPPVFSVFVRGFIAHFNHLDVTFDPWVFAVFTIVGLVFTVGLIRLGWRERASFQAWLIPALFALAAVVSTALVINTRSYLALVVNGEPFAQGRYLMLLVPIFGVFVALGSYSLGSRYGKAIATAVACALGGLTLFGMVMSLERFYL